MKITLQRWTGRNWEDTLTSPFKNMSEVMCHVKKYSWHYTKENPYRIVDYKSKKKVSKYVPKYNTKSWNMDDDMVVQIGRR